jgi:hypothetical protein
MLTVSLLCVVMVNCYVETWVEDARLGVVEESKFEGRVSVFIVAGDGKYPSIKSKRRGK